MVSADFKILVVVDNVSDCKLLKQLSEIGFDVLTCNKNPIEVIKKCSDNSPQYLLADEDFYLIIRKMEMKILLESMGTKVIVLPYENDYELKEFMYAILSYSSTPLSKINNIHLSKKSCIDEMVGRALNELGFLSIYLGSEYIQTIMKAICNSRLNCTDSMSKKIYPYVAKIFIVTPESVERSIRTAIEKCWEYSDLSVKKKYFGVSLRCMKSRPTNREFIAVLGEYFLHELKGFRFDA